MKKNNYKNYMKDRTETIAQALYFKNFRSMPKKWQAKIVELATLDYQDFIIRITNEAAELSKYLKLINKEKKHGI